MHVFNSRADFDAQMKSVKKWMRTGQALDGVGRVGGQLAVPAVYGHVFVGAHQHALRQGAVHGVGNVFPGDQRAAVNRVDHAAGAQKGVERHIANGGALRVVMQRRIGMRAHVGR